MMSSSRSDKVPLSDQVIIAVSQLVDDAQTGTREPSHSDIEFQIEQVSLQEGDPKSKGQTVGKAKRVRGTLSWALENNPQAGEKLVVKLITLIKGYGGFRDTSPNFVGSEAIKNAIGAFKSEGYNLTQDGELRPLMLESLSGAALTEALESYVRRAKRGIDDAALLTGTGKDLLEATAAHVITERWGSYSSMSNFPTLLGQAFIALDLATTETPREPNEKSQRRMERAMYELGCAINHLRNREGTGHGRPWLPQVTDIEAKTAIELMGSIAEYLLEALKKAK